MKKIELYTLALIFGEAAFRAGQTSEPWHDSNCMQLMEENDGNAVLILKAWAKGWHSAYWASPVS